MAGDCVAAWLGRCAGLGWFHQQNWGKKRFEKWRFNPAIDGALKFITPEKMWFNQQGSSQDLKVDRPFLWWGYLQKGWLTNKNSRYINYPTWLVVWNMFYFFHILGIIIPIDFHMFQRGSNHQPANINASFITNEWISYDFMGLRHLEN